MKKEISRVRFCEILELLSDRDIHYWYARLKRDFDKNELSVNINNRIWTIEIDEVLSYIDKFNNGKIKLNKKHN